MKGVISWRRHSFRAISLPTLPFPCQSLSVNLYFFKVKMRKSKDFDNQNSKNVKIIDFYIWFRPVKTAKIRYGGFLYCSFCSFFSFFYSILACCLDRFLSALASILACFFSFSAISDRSDSISRLLPQYGQCTFICSGATSRSALQLGHLVVIIFMNQFYHSRKWKKSA